MTVGFTKMHGTGNDFILVDCRSSVPFSDIPEAARRLCHRRFGIGADGLILILKSSKADSRMRIFNADGSEAEMCGNGIRCFAKYLYDHGLVKQKSLTVETLAGIIRPEVLNGLVRVDMGMPKLARRDIPLMGKDSDKVLNEPLALKDRNISITAVSMGNPHAVLFVEDIGSYPVEAVGREVENNNLFPQKTNVEFVEVLNKDELRIRVWERGVGETMACGTGACASLVASFLNGKTHRKARVHLPGGVLEVDWRDDNRVFMTGPAEEVFKGELEV
ncbi:MAG: diaminopimelate epimerase [Candidatus Altiarchaeota archaeon]|nr:diaminopimelate epimerase [Candidatus Altiarchaeota archaeon]